jgi:hypothetical protein
LDLPAPDKVADPHLHYVAVSEFAVDRLIEQRPSHGRLSVDKTNLTYQIVEKEATEYVDAHSDY